MLQGRKDMAPYAGRYDGGMEARSLTMDRRARLGKMKMAPLNAKRIRRGLGRKWAGMAEAFRVLDDDEGSSPSSIWNDSSSSKPDIVPYADRSLLKYVCKRVVVVVVVSLLEQWLEAGGPHLAWLIF